MAKPARLVTEFTDVEFTAKLLHGAMQHGIESAGPASALHGLTPRQVASAAAMVLYALGEVYERQFYPSDRDECQDVAREVLTLAGILPPQDMLTPDTR